MRILMIFLIVVMVGCAAAPTKMASKVEFLKGDYKGNASHETIKDNLTRANNHLSEGYEVVATLLTPSYFISRANENAKMNMDSEKQKNLKISNDLSLIKGKTCFMVTVSTYSIEKAKFKYWRAKVKDHTGEMIDVLFENTRGVASVPTTYKDINGRTWHNNSWACAAKKIDISKNFSVFFIPQINQTDDPKSELTWGI